MVQGNWFVSAIAQFAENELCNISGVVLLTSFSQNLKGYSLANGLFAIGFENNFKIICNVLNEHKVLKFFESIHKIFKSEALLCNDAFLNHIVL